MYDLVHSSFFTMFIVPLLICLARITDVSLGTLRIIFIARGLKILAPVVGFFEIIIWLLAISQVMQNLDNIFNILAYATGFSLGNFLGISLEEKLAMGKNIIRIISAQDTSMLVSHLRENNFSVTVAEGEGRHGHVSILFAVTRRAELPIVLEAVKRFHPNAFYTIEDLRMVSGGVFPAPDRLRTKSRILTRGKK
ncbi:MAG: hypothetical protein CSB24_02850 [Deltaproteobacteria bacterium]|nr:MAG: hypothetical protein CSB24_02850 [Deltaproteobacteria bacterium]